MFKALRNFLTRWRSRSPSSGVLRASYDVYTSSEFARQWARATLGGSLYAAHNPGVRRRLMAIARYEVSNNSLLQHIINLHVAYCCSRGPKLRVTTANPGFNAMVESVWERWVARTGFAKTLRACWASKIIDGEAFLQIYRGPDDDLIGSFRLAQLPPENITHGVLAGTGGGIDGLVLDEYNKIVGYYVLPYSPTDIFAVASSPKLVDAKFIKHWFRRFSELQYRGVTELAPVLELCALLRRYRSAVITAAEIAAQYALVLKTEMDPARDEDEYVQRAAQSWSVDKGAAMILPSGWSAEQLKTEHPSAQYQAVIEQLIAEIARALSMPFIVAAADARQANFSSARIDHLLYQRAVEVQRAECEEALLEPIFEAWFKEEALRSGWFADYDREERMLYRTTPPPHDWSWPAFPAIQPEIAAQADKLNLEIGLAHRRQLAAAQGKDIDDEDAIAAADLGLTVEQYREMLRQRLYEVPKPLTPSDEGDQGDALPE